MYVEVNVSITEDSSQVPGLIYSVAPLIGDRASFPRPMPAVLKLDRALLRTALRRLRNQLNSLLNLAGANKPRGQQGVEETARELAELAFGLKGFAGIVRPGWHPHISTKFDEAAAIPWEVFEEYIGTCGNKHCREHERIFFLGYSPPQHDSFCNGCGGKLRVGGGKLAVDRQISHLVWGGEATHWSSGNEFLLIVDPHENLCTLKDTDDKRQPAEHEVAWAKECRQHVQDIERMLTESGYRVMKRSGRNVTAKWVLDRIADPEVVGLYFFGHGCFPADGKKGMLMLAEGETLTARDIEQSRNALRFAFLNACQAAAAPVEWSLEQSATSAAEAFAQGNKVVIAPTIPMFKVHAARAARSFFEAALSGDTIDVALQKVRKFSLQRYTDNNDTDLAWMAYRHLGPPDRTLPKSRPRLSPSSDASVERPTLQRVFGTDGRIDSSVFGFGFGNVLFRAGKRRFLWGRKSVTVSDLFAGLVRCGGLTRLLLRKLGKRPDALYDKLQALYDTGFPTPEQVRQRKERISEYQGRWKRSADEELKESSQSTGNNGAVAHNRPEDLTTVEKRPETDTGDDGKRSMQAIAELIRSIVVTKRDELGEEVQQLLRRTDERAQSNRNEHRTATISEFDILCLLSEEEFWPEIGSIPERGAFRSLLDGRSWLQDVDENGQLNLDDLEPAARRVVLSAHDLSQHRRVRPVSSRLVLASFLVDQESYASQLVERTCIPLRAKALSDRLIATVKSGSADPYPLTAEACRHSLLPAVQRARELARARSFEKPAQVSEWDLFVGFCETAPNPLTAMLRVFEPPYNIDLTLLARIARAERAVTPELTRSTSRRTDDFGDKGGRPSRIGRAAVSAGQRARVLSSTPAAGPDAVAATDFDADAWNLILTARQWAVIQRAPAIQPVHFWVAFLEFPSERIAQLIQNSACSPDRFRRHLLSAESARQGPAEPDSPAVTDLSEDTFAIVTRARDRNSNAQASLRDLESELLDFHDDSLDKSLLEIGIQRSDGKATDEKTE